MDRRVFLRTGGLGLAGLSAFTYAFSSHCTRYSAESRPNIVFILADDLGWNQLGCYGGAFYETPNLDRLAVEGMRFTDAYAAAPVCSPTRASIMTGKYPARLNLTDFLKGGENPEKSVLLHPEWTKYLMLEEKTIAEALQGEGYRTAAFGKWHLSKEKTPPESESHNPDKQGFDHSFVTYKPVPSMARKWQRPEDDGHNVRIITAKSLEFIENNRHEPFFLYMTHNTIHTPLMEKQALIKKYEAKKDSILPQNNPVIGAMVETMDRSVGQVVARLAELDLTRNTVVIFFSDNGGLEKVSSQIPLKRGKACLYEGGIRVPLIVKWPGKTTPGSVCATPVSSIDFFPTLLQMVEGKERNDEIDGASLVPLLTRSGDLEREAIYWHYPHYHSSGVAPSGAIRSGKYKLIEWFEKSVDGVDREGALELYDLENDIHERNNLVKEMPQKALELYHKLKSWRKEVGAQEMKRR